MYPSKTCWGKPKPKKRKNSQQSSSLASRRDTQISLDQTAKFIVDFVQRFAQFVAEMRGHIFERVRTDSYFILFHQWCELKFVSLLVYILLDSSFALKTTAFLAQFLDDQLSPGGETSSWAPQKLVGSLVAQSVPKAKPPSLNLAGQPTGGWLPKWGLERTSTKCS